MGRSKIMVFGMVDGGVGEVNLEGKKENEAVHLW